MRILGKRVFIRIVKRGGTTSGGILIPTSCEKRTDEADVIGVGEECTVDISIGDRIIYDRSKGITVGVEDRCEVLIDEGDIIAKIESSRDN